MNTTGSLTSRHTDLLVVGAGIVGIAHAVEALHRGLSVRVIERDARAVGASIRNFGHACITAQADDVQPTAGRSRTGWLRAAAASGIWAAEAGCVVVARNSAEMTLLEQFAIHRGGDQAVLITADQVLDRLYHDERGNAETGIVGGAFLPGDLRVDPRQAVGGLTDWVAAQPGAAVHFRTNAVSIGEGEVATNRGTFTADQVVVCVGHDVDHLFPAVADAWEITRCALQMALAAPVAGYVTDSAVLSGTSMLRYGGFSDLPTADQVQEQLAADRPQLLDIAANIMFTRRPDGTLLLGDSHAYALAQPPFLDESVTGTLLAEITSILGVPRLQVRQRWQGIYASSPLTDTVRERVDAATTVITVTSGIGMTLSFGLAADTFDQM